MFKPLFRCVFRCASVSSTYPGTSVRPSVVHPSVILSDFHSVSVFETSQSVAAMVADMEMHMVADMEVNKVAGMAADKKRKENMKLMYARKRS